MQPVAEFHDVNRERFDTMVVPRGRPAVLRGLVADWPAVQAARQGYEALADYLRGVASEEPFEAWFGAPEIGGRFGYNEAFDGYNHERRLATVGQLLDLLMRQRGHDAPYSMYAGGIPIRKHLPGLMPDIGVPLLDKSRETLISLWLGNRTRVAPHWDLPQNLACVIAGRRRFTLFPTEQLKNLYVGPLDFTLAGQPTSLVDLDNPDFERHPRFREALQVAETVELAPGDALYLPSLWWHAVSSLDEIGAMVNFWWRAGDPPHLSPRNALYHAVITLKDLPPKERERWRIFFNHYVFGDDGDPVEHLPEQARGILGRRTPELVARVKALLVQALSR
ncbi:cupin-like domain-containing protein [Sphingomonas sp. SM33]|uniref:Cupin-like domain-containing protein n=1 Tax=Sphingomonas telluris TaxID=2907998 RepID=A0ABS9VNC8_9SPHN|nr:cupin-like domain-containing protein [Sphingomonas telluris]